LLAFRGERHRIFSIGVFWASLPLEQSGSNRIALKEMSRLPMYDSIQDSFGIGKRRQLDSRLTIPDANHGAVFELEKEIPTIPAASEEVMKVQEMPSTVVKVHEIPSTLVVEWNDDAKAMIDTWSSYQITIAQFREAILVKGLSYAKAHGGRAWVMDGTKAQGAMAKDVQNLIETEVFKTFAANGIKYFVTIKSTESALANSAIKRFTSHLGPCGIQMVEVPDRQKAIAWLKEHP
jgi:hypothetical protein